MALLQRCDQHDLLSLFQGPKSILNKQHRYGQKQHYSRFTEFQEAQKLRFAERHWFELWSNDLFNDHALYQL